MLSTSGNQNRPSRRPRPGFLAGSSGFKPVPGVKWRIATNAGLSPIFSPIFCVVYLATLVLFAVVAFPQDKLRKIDEERYKYKNTPISVTYELGNQPFAFRNETTANPEWLRELTLKVTNISGKTIKSFTILLIIEKQGSMEYQAAMPVRFPLDGEPVLDTLGKLTGRYKTQTLKPGESVKLRGPDSVNQHSILEMLKSRDGITDISTVFLDIRYVYFEDGTSWQLGIDIIPDPNRPGRYIYKTHLLSRGNPLQK